ncbi:MAG: hypothetical protein OEQ24_01545 [Gammaproteobacteria bacterium]|nr:hypothetical protein [Gammaproteobacteria bacterium]
MRQVFLLIVWLLGFLFISSGLERSQQLREGVLTVYREKRIAFIVSLPANIRIYFILAVTFAISTLAYLNPVKSSSSVNRIKAF